MLRSTDLPELESLCPLLDRFASLRLVVWGDLVADRFLMGSTTRVSREAPALVLRYEDEITLPGGAGNAAVNAVSLGATVAAIGYLGSDIAGEEVHEALRDAGVRTSGIVQRLDGSTPVKTRIMAGGQHTARQQILRVDRDPRWKDDSVAAERLWQNLDSALTDADALLISDYDLGTVAPAMFQRLGESAHEVRPTTLDSRSALLSFPGVTAATPNEAEVEEALQVNLDGDRSAIESAGKLLLSRLRSDALIITRGSRGMVVFERDADSTRLPIYGSDQIADVTGAGDTVIAALSLGLAAGASTVEAACLANIAAGLAVLKHGTRSVNRVELAEALRASQ